MWGSEDTLLDSVYSSHLGIKLRVVRFSSKCLHSVSYFSGPLSKDSTIKQLQPGEVVHAFNCSLQESEADGYLSPRPAWSEWQTIWNQ